MSRVKIDLPNEFPFTTIVPIRITDINYGGHVGNDTILSIIHEVRLQYLAKYGYTELDFAGTGLIMSDAAIEFKQEMFYGDSIQASVAIADLSRVSFAFYYKLERKSATGIVLAAAARTGMVCYNYSTKKIAAVPEKIREQFGI